jgi:hypothetical protein
MMENVIWIVDWGRGKRREGSPKMSYTRCYHLFTDPSSNVVHVGARGKTYQTKRSRSMHETHARRTLRRFLSLRWARWSGSQRTTRRGITHLCFFIFFLRLRLVLSSSTARPPSSVLSAESSPSRRNVASQLTALLTAFIASVRARSRAVSASASGVVSGGSSRVAWAGVAEAETAGA